MTVPSVAPLYFTVAWSGLDNASGAREYDIEYTSGGPWLAWLNGITATQTSFLGESGASYTFRVRATDRVNNVGDWLEVGPVQISSVTKYYVHGGQKVAMRRGDEVYYLHGDHLGSTSLTTDQSGAVVSDARYLPYGEERWSNGETPTDFGFTSQRNERGFGLYDYNARYYSPRLGRFISPDTIVPEPWHSGAFNRYTYVSNNPIRHIDPTGHGCNVACPPAPPQISWQDLVKLAPSLAVSAPEAPAAVMVTITAVTFATGAYYGSSWAMQDMGPNNPENPWMGPAGLADAVPLQDGALIDVTTPFPGTSTLGSNVESSLVDALPLEDPATTQLQIPPFGGQIEGQTNIPGFSLDAGVEMPDMSILESRVIQSGGSTIKSGTAKKLNEYYGLDIQRRDWGRALEALKNAWGLSRDHHGKIEEDGTYTDSDGNVIDNIFDYLP